MEQALILLAMAAVTHGKILIINDTDVNTLQNHCNNVLKANYLS